MPKKKEMTTKTKHVFDEIFTNDVNPMKAMELREKAIDYIQSVKGNDPFLIKLSVTDIEQKHWRKDEHFVKVFYFEMKHIEEYYSVTKSQKDFLFAIGEFLMWETNLLVDECDNPLNQKSIAEKLNINPKTVQRNMKALEDRCIIYKIKIWNEIYYLVNPYIMFLGKNINIAIPNLFEGIGYISSVMVDKKNTRTYRKKEQEKRVIIGEN